MWTVILGFVAVIGCVTCTAFFVAAEFALVTVRQTWVEELVRTAHKRARAVKNAVTKLDDAIAATQLGITLASIALGAVGEPAVAHALERPFVLLFPRWHLVAAHTIATAIAFVAITFLDAVLGELVPKAIALHRPERIVLRIARPLIVFQTVFRPAIYLMNFVGNRVVRLFGYEPARGRARVHSVGELKMLVEQTEVAGDLDPTQADVVGNALDLLRKRVREVMVPRERVQALDLAMTEREVLDAVNASHHARMPVWSAEAQEWIGVAVTKLLLLQFLRDGRVRLEEAMYKPDVFHHAAPVPRVLRAFRSHRQHMAFVAGDDGARIGVVTLEDVLEELVGEIEDELDVESGLSRMNARVTTDFQHQVLRSG